MGPLSVEEGDPAVAKHCHHQPLPQQQMIDPNCISIGTSGYLTLLRAS